MDRPNFAAMDTALYQASKEMIPEIIIQKDITIAQLRGRIDAMEIQKNQKIQELEERLANLEREKNKRINELEQKNYALKQQIIGLEDRIKKRGLGTKIQEQREQQRMLEKAFIQKANKWSHFNGVVNVWEDLQKMQTIDIGEGGMEKLPQKLFQLTQLKNLYLYQNKLREIPETIGSLKELQTLWLQNNQLTKLPQSLGNLRELTVLSLYSNQLTELPQSLGNLKELKQLHLNSNQLTELPESLGNLSKLQALSICYNPNLKQLPKSFKNLKELNYLHIDWQLLPRQNIFKTEPFASLKNLQTLYIYNENGNKQRREATKKEGSQMKVQVYYWINGQWQ